MTEITVYGSILTANKEERTFTGLMLPFGEVGATSIGSVTASAGTVQLPEDPSTVHLNLEHDGLRPVGKAVSFEEKADGIHATFRVAKTTSGNDLLAEIEEGLRASLSVEIANPVVRSGQLLSGSLTGCGAVVKPAFASAAIYSLTAADCGETLKETPMENTSTPLEAAEVTSVVQAAPIYAADSTKTDLAALTFENLAKGAEGLNAALQVVTNSTDTANVYVADQELGTLWEAKKVSRPLINAFGVKPLNSLTISGRYIERTFEVKPYAGMATEVPSVGVVSSTRLTKTAQAYGGAARVPSELIEFGNVDIIAELYSEGLDDYAVRTEAAFATELLGASTKQTAAVANVLEVVDHASQTFAASGSRMDIILVSPDVFSGLVSLPASQAPWWLAGQASLSLSGSTLTGAGVSFGVSTALTGGQVLIADKRAASYYESKDFRVQAVAAANFSVDIALVKYNVALVSDAGAIFHYTNVGTEINAPAPAA